MTPNDLYSECVPRYQKRKSTVCMAFPLVERQFLGRPTVAAEQKARLASMRANKRKVMPYRILEQLAIKCAPMGRDGEIPAQ
jgi:hypothetical protein